MSGGSDRRPRIGRQSSVLALAALVPFAAAACGDGTATWTVSDGLVTVAFSVAGPLAGDGRRPGLPPVSRHFALVGQVCAPAGLASGLRVDADMPAHRHGMNYRTTVQWVPEGHWRADGLLWHMPGRWRIVLDVQTAQGPRRLTQTVDVP